MHKFKREKRDNKKNLPIRVYKIVEVKTDKVLYKEKTDVLTFVANYEKLLEDKPELPAWSQMRSPKNLDADYVMLVEV